MITARTQANALGGAAAMDSTSTAVPLKFLTSQYNYGLHSLNHEPIMQFSIPDHSRGRLENPQYFRT